MFEKDKNDEGFFLPPRRIDRNSGIRLLLVSVLASFNLPKTLPETSNIKGAIYVCSRGDLSLGVCSFCPVLSHNDLSDTEKDVWYHCPTGAANTELKLMFILKMLEVMGTLRLNVISHAVIGVHHIRCSIKSCFCSHKIQSAVRCRLCLNLVK